MMEEWKNGSNWPFGKIYVVYHNGAIDVFGFDE
jgi:hypothetical protein